jgi:hypothetical protein
MNTWPMVLCGVAAIAAGGCAHVRTAAILDLTGPADGETLVVRAMDARTGAVYDGTVHRQTAGAGPLAAGPIPTVLRTDADGCHVDAVWWVQGD